ncbi:RNA polymerase sigma factor [Paenibacillus mendelii]|uniref:RNA polymerase sigma factor n=1 Tax=Paenibacillus mendelii TaxID=206163 RepID=A0ABV6JJ74_9BACL|nr:RNA polymerase sigma factor [Paenibacillus mendelii]MCQ6558663.1 RNA polymerase sigma factor [Paenibacillus mendelii]
MMDNGKAIGFEQHEAQIRDLYNQMIRVAYAKVANKSDAQDAVQEAWVRILTKQDTLREQSKLNSWAKAITTNVALNINRQTKRSQPSDLLVQEQQDPDCDTSSEAELMMELSELLGLLDPKARTLLLYKFYYGFKDQEIADAMKVPVGTVKARIHRTKLLLRRLMDEQQM